MILSLCQEIKNKMSVFDSDCFKRHLSYVFFSFVFFHKFFLIRYPKPLRISLSCCLLLLGTRPIHPTPCSPTLWTFSQKTPAVVAVRPEKLWCTDWPTTCWRSCHRTMYHTRYVECTHNQKNLNFLSMTVLDVLYFFLKCNISTLF